jgi:hypothetical protein
VGKSSGFSNAGGTKRIIDAAQSPGWSIGEGRSGQIMATSDSGEIGSPWVVMATKSGRGMKVSLYRPGDNVEVEGDVVGEIVGNPREMGRQFRTILEDTSLSNGL